MSADLHDGIEAYVENVLALHGSIQQLDAESRSQPLSKHREYSAGHVEWDDVSRRGGETDRFFPLDMKVKEQYERLLGSDLSKVRIHTGPEADSIARSNGALAVSIGYDLYFSQGMYAPDSEEGLKLLAHELTHVVQFQRGDRLLYAEDIAVLEDHALALESALADVRLHGVHRSVIAADGSESVNPEAIAEARAESGQEAPLSISTTGTGMDTFRGRSRGTRYHVQLPSGKTVAMRGDEYRQMIERVSLGVREWLEEEQMVHTSEEYDRLMLRFYRWLHRSCA